MKPCLTLLVVCITVLCTKAQKIDSIYFHLYTDSLKKGTHNYINVDGKTTEGKWLPLSNKEIYFSSTGGRFEGNSLVLDTGFNQVFVRVKAVLKADTTKWKETIIYIKILPNKEPLKTMQEVLNKPVKKN